MTRKGKTMFEKKGRFRAAHARLILLFILTFSGPVNAAPVTHLIVAGSGTNLPIMRILAQEFQRSHPGISIEVPTSIGSTSGIRAAADGAIAIGLISRPLKEDEKKLGLTVVPYARTPLIIGVHQEVTEEEISYAEILAIYRGEKRTWRDGQEIIVLTREPGDSTIEVMNKQIAGFREVYEESQQAKRWATLLNDLEMDKALARTPHAIGFSDLGSLTIEAHPIKALRVNGVAPTLKNAETGVYPLLKPLYCVFQQEKLQGSGREFLDFVRSAAGAKILRQNGYLPER